MLIRTRREFFRTVLGSLGAAGALGKFGEMAALANNPSNNYPYQALVCIFLAGGNDGHNTVFPVSTIAKYETSYLKYRGPLALPSPGVSTTIHNAGDVYGVHPNMPEIAALYNQGVAAVIANVGNLVQPITKAQYQSPGAVVPLQLFSHADQVNQWQSAIPDKPANTGWGGRAEDLMAQSANAGAQFSPITSTSGCGLFCTGTQTFASTVPVGGASLLQGATSGPRLNAVNALMQFDNGLKLVSAANQNYLRGVGFSQALNAALASAKVTTPFPSTLLGQQLLTVAKIISIHQVLGITRQVFFCQLGGFDTHSDELNGQAPLLQQLSQAVSAFYTATCNIAAPQGSPVPMQNLVTTFTASEFGRTLQPNGNGGTDHAWGSHHFVIGGDVLGGKFYGQFPDLSLGGPDDANTRGTLIPTTSIAQYAATLASWFGVDQASLPGVSPKIVNFTVQNLGFLA